MCKEMPVNPVNRVVGKKRINRKMEGQGGGGEAQGVTAPPHTMKLNGSFSILFFRSSVHCGVICLANDVCTAFAYDQTTGACNLGT
jgi:hypothetical protein